MSRARWSGALLALAVTACGPPPPTPDVFEVTVTGLTPRRIVSTSTVRLMGTGFEPGDTGSIFLANGSDVGGDSIEGFSYASPTELQAQGGNFRVLENYATDGYGGEVRLDLVRDGERHEVWFALEKTSYHETLTPSITAISPLGIAFGETLALEGEDFLLPDEGDFTVVFDGTYTPTAGTATAFSALALPATVVSRMWAEVPFSPALFGLVPGQLSGTLTPVQTLESAAAVGAATAIELQVLEPTVAAVEPTAASRGQRIAIRGRGFLGEDASLSQSTTIELTGTFTDAAGTVTDLSSTPLSLAPTLAAEGELEFVLRPEVSGGRLVGLGAVPGTLVGQARVVLRSGGDTHAGPWRELTFTVAPTRQVVFLKYLPAFRESLARFGLTNVEAEVKARVLEVCKRDYAGYALDFRDERPTDFQDYTVLELTGLDPNGAGLLGLDNTSGHDVGNLHLDDVIGGKNAEQEELGSYAFGGVFLDSFFAFSSWSVDAGPLADPRFDAAFSAMAPELGGTEVAAGEYPSGSRDAAIAEAIRVLGNLVGNTVVHEIGHALGLASTGSVHHDGNTPGLLMNPGAARPFGERAELDGEGPAVWGPDDTAYLALTLPSP